MKDILVSLFLVGSVVAGASETAGVTNFMEGENPLGATVRSFVPSRPSFGSAAPANSPSGAPVSSMYIAHTDGTGVRVRTECSPDAPGSGAIPEGATVQLVRVGGAECPGWALVSADGSESWVRMTYLNAANPAKQASNGSSAGAGKGAAASSDGANNAANPGRAQGQGASSNGKATLPAGGPSTGDGRANAPTAVPNLGVTKGLATGQGWGQGVGGGQDHPSSALPSAAGSGQGWGQGVGDGQDHQSSGLPAPGASGDSSAAAKPK